MKPIRILSILLALAAISIQSSCQDGNDAPDTSNRRVVVEMSYTFDTDAGSDCKMQLSYPTADGENVVAEIIENGQTWSKTVTYNSLPTVVGLHASCMITDDNSLQRGATVKANYSSKCFVTLLEDDKVIDSKFIEESESEAVTLSDDDKYSELFDFFDTSMMLSVSTDKISKVDTVDDSEDMTSEEQPKHDITNVKLSNTLYYLNPIDLNPTAEYLHDNMLARFNNKSQWNRQILSKGDFLFLKGSEIQSVDKGVVKQSVEAGTILVLNEVDSYTTLKQFCTDLDIYNPMVDDSRDLSHSIFIIADAHINLSSNVDSPYHGLFFMLSPIDSNGEYMDDYHQGCNIDHALTRIKEVFDGTAGAANIATRGSEPEDLTKIVSAYIVWLNSDGGCKQTLSSSDYRKASKASNGATNFYNIEYDIWNVYSLTDKRNYYYIHQGIVASFANTYKGVYSCAVTTDGCHTIAKVCEWYGKAIEVEVVPENTAGLQIHRHAPSTTQTDYTYTSGLSWNLGGSLAVKGGGKGTEATGSISGGISVSNSTTHTDHDITVSNLSVPDQKLEWKFDLMAAFVKYAPFNTACTSMHEGSLTGRTTFNGCTDFVISFPESEQAPKLKGKMTVTLRSTCGKAGQECGVRETSQAYDVSFELPYLKASDIEN